MAIDFTFSPEVEQARSGIREFLHNTVKAATPRSVRTRPPGGGLVGVDQGVARRSQNKGILAAPYAQEVGGMGLGVTALAAVSAEAAKVPYGSYILNAHAPDEGNMHTLHHFATQYQRERYLNPLLEGDVRSCFSMTEPEVAGSDPTLIQTTAVEDGATSG